MKFVALSILTLANAALPASSVIDTRSRAAMRLVEIKEGKRWQTVEEMFLDRGFRQADRVNPSRLRTHNGTTAAEPRRRADLGHVPGTLPSDVAALVPDAWRYLAMLLEKQPATVVARNIRPASEGIAAFRPGFPTAAVRG
jgi:hypothetical protein